MSSMRYLNAAALLMNSLSMFLLEDYVSSLLLIIVALLLSTTDKDNRIMAITIMLAIISSYLIDGNSAKYGTAFVLGLIIVSNMIEVNLKNEEEQLNNED